MDRCNRPVASFLLSIDEILKAEIPCILASVPPPPTPRMATHQNGRTGVSTTQAPSLTCGGGAAAVNHGVRGGGTSNPPPNSLPLCTMNYMTTKSSYSTRGVHQKSLLGLQFSPKYGGGEVYGGRTSNLPPPPNSLPLCTMPWAEVGLLNPLKKGGGFVAEKGWQRQLCQ